MNQPRILAFSGSARRESFNQRLVSIAVNGAKAAGADVTLINLGDFPLPIFSEDVEADGTPENVTKLKQLFLDHDGLLISCPEYNSSITPLLKNAIDWVSRPVEGEPGLAAYIDKVAVLMATSPGGLGGLRGLVHVRAILQNIGVVVLPNQTALPSAYSAFEGDRLKDEKTQAKVEGLGAELAKFLGRIRNSS